MDCRSLSWPENSGTMPQHIPTKKAHMASSATVAPTQRGSQRLSSSTIGLPMSESTVATTMYHTMELKYHSRNATAPTLTPIIMYRASRFTPRCAYTSLPRGQR